MANIPSGMQGAAENAPLSVVAVSTAVPAFVGYTERADKQGVSLHNRPWRIKSMVEFTACFGGPPPRLFSLLEHAPGGGASPDLLTPLPGSKKGEKKGWWLAQDSVNYLLYSSLQLFFDNGGGVCYIVSVGAYGQDVAPAALLGGMAALEAEQEPTLLVVPEAVLLTGTAGKASAGCIAVQQAMLHHCGQLVKNRFAILDVHDGFLERSAAAGDVITAFRSHIGEDNLSSGAAYHPWLHTIMVQQDSLSFTNVSSIPLLQAMLSADMMLDPAHRPLDPALQAGRKDKVRAVAALAGPWKVDGAVFGTSADVRKAQRALHEKLAAYSPLYVAAMATMAGRLSRLPPSAAIAGVYTTVDNNRGVWRAPANVSLAGVTSPAVEISQHAQEDLNVTASGKSVNAIRSFSGKGVLVWGARTLDGNSLDWRYVNVRRTAMMMEESARLALAAYAYEPNAPATWTAVKGALSNFLTTIWQQGGLAGATPKESFSVQVGLGESMTAADLSAGRLRINMLVALVRPAEFMAITLEQQLHAGA